MEKALHGAHGVGYEVYKQKHKVRMLVERRREKDYVKSQRMIADLGRKMHNNNVIKTSVYTLVFCFEFYWG